MSGSTELEFRDWSARELAEVLLTRPDEVVEIEVRTPEGVVLTRSVEFAISSGSDTDRVETYTWLRVVVPSDPPEK